MYNYINFFIYSICISVYLYCYERKITFMSDIIIAIISCNRYIYLNSTLLSITNHLKFYENKIKFNNLFIDQGTIQRYTITESFKLYNAIFMNPIGYSLSFNIIFSYLYTKYLFLLEEDWEVVKDIEKHILHPSFIQESIFILDKMEVIYGLLLRQSVDIKVNYSITINTIMGKHILYILKPPKDRYSFTNGASIYRTKDLKKLKHYINEYSTSQYFRHNNYKLGYTYKGLKGKKNSTEVQYVMRHIGKVSTRNGMCNIWLY